MIICPICQSENEVDFTECILCGAPLPTPEPTEAKAEKSEASTPPPRPATTPEAATNHHSTLTVPPPSVLPEATDILAKLPTSPSSSGLMGTQPDPVISTRPVLSRSDAPMSHLPGPPEVRQITRPPEQTVPATPFPQIPAEPELPPSDTLCLIVYFERRPSFYLPVIYDELLIGRTDPASNAYPDLDVTPFDPELAISRKHCYLYREGEEYYIYPISNSGTQVNQEMIDIGTKKRLREGDVIILSGRLAIRFARIP